MQKNLYLIYAMQRSGQHAIINWMGNQLGNCKFINNAGWSTVVREFGSRYGGTEDEGKCYGNATEDKFDNLIVSFENFSPKDVLDERLTDIMAQVHKKYNNVYSVIILRDPLNWLASMMKMHWRFAEYFKNHYLADVYIKQAEEYFGNTKYLSNLVKINYNTWCTDTTYRHELSVKLNFNEFTDEGIYTPSFTGSSFDNEIKFPNFQIFSRYKEYEGNLQFEEILQIYPRLLSIAKDEFNIEKE